MVYQILDSTGPLDQRALAPSRMLYRKADWESSSVKPNGYADDWITWEILELNQAEAFLGE